MDAEPDGRLMNELGRLRETVPELQGCLVASTDGLLIAGDARPDVAEGVAALSAACLGVSQRVVDVVGHRVFREVVVNASGGYVAMYLLNGSAVLVFLATPAANLGRLNHEARRAVPVLAGILESAAVTRSTAVPPFVELSSQAGLALPHRAATDPDTGAPRRHEP